MYVETHNLKRHIGSLAEPISHRKSSAKKQRDLATEDVQKPLPLNAKKTTSKQLVAYLPKGIYPEKTAVKHSHGRMYHPERTRMAALR